MFYSLVRVMAFGTKQKRWNEGLDGVVLSLHSLVGLSEPRTLKLKGEVHGMEVMVLIDYGATHNFISTNLVEVV